MNTDEMWRCPKCSSRIAVVMVPTDEKNDHLRIHDVADGERIKVLQTLIEQMRLNIDSLREDSKAAREAGEEVDAEVLFAKSEGLLLGVDIVQSELWLEAPGGTAG